MMTEPIEATYRISQEEYLEAYTAHCKPAVKRAPGYWPVQAVGAFFGIAIGLSLFRLPPWLAIWLAIGLIANFSVSRWRMRKLRKFQYSVRHDSEETVTARLDETGYHYLKQGACSGWMSWSHFDGWRETPNTIILGHGVAFVALPKRVFAEEQQAELRSLFNERIHS